MADPMPIPGLARRDFLLTSSAWIGMTMMTEAINAASSPDKRPALRLSGPSTALVLIDLQNSNADAPFAPIGFKQVVANSLLLADAVRRSGGLVVYTRVIVQQIAKLPTDVKLPTAPAKPGGDDLAAEAGMKAGDALVTKRQFGAFYGTDLEDQLHRRGVTTVIFGGVATEAGVESTARAALDRGYALVFAKDALSGASMHSNAMFLDKIFPVIGRVRTTAEIVASLAP